MFEKFKKLKLKREYIVVIICIITVFIIVFSTFYDNNNSRDTTKNANDYVDILEQKLKRSIEQIEGVNSATVIISVESGITTVIAEDVKKTEENGKTTYASSPVLVGGEPIILGEIYPDITGVVVVCNCKDNFIVNSYVLDLLTTVLDISCDKIRILTQ